MLHEHLETHVVGEDGGAVLKGSFVSDDYAILSLIKEQWISDIYCCILTNIDYRKVLVSNPMWSYVVFYNQKLIPMVFTQSVYHKVLIK